MCMCNVLVDMFTENALFFDFPSSNVERSIMAMPLFSKMYRSQAKQMSFVLLVLAPPPPSSVH